MGYRVGWQCLATSEQAHDYVLSQLLPTITQDGQLIRPVKKGDSWYLAENKIQMSFPNCDPIDNIKQGALIGVPIVGLFVLVFGIRSIIAVVKSMSVAIGSDNDN